MAPGKDEKRKDGGDSSLSRMRRDLVEASEIGPRSRNALELGAMFALGAFGTFCLVIGLAVYAWLSHGLGIAFFVVSALLYLRVVRVGVRRGRRRGPRDVRQLPRDLREHARELSRLENAVLAELRQAPLVPDGLPEEVSALAAAGRAAITRAGELDRYLTGTTREASGIRTQRAALVGQVEQVETALAGLLERAIETRTLAEPRVDLQSDARRLQERLDALHAALGETRALGRSEPGP